MRQWQCRCGYVHVGQTPPPRCIHCQLPGRFFKAKIMKRYRCKVCDYLWVGSRAPYVCPRCQESFQNFVMMGRW